MIADQHEIVANVIVAAVRSATATLTADLRVVQAQMTGWEARWSDLGALRERLAVVEDRAKSVPLPAVVETRASVDLAPVLARLDVLEARDVPVVDLDDLVLRAAALIPTPKDGKDAPAVDLDALVARVVALVPIPKDGKDAPPIDVEDLARRAAALIPIPKDGKDAPVLDVEDVARKAAALIPTPRDGQPGVPGRDGKDPPPVDLDDLATRAAMLIPTPKDGAPGRDGTLETLQVKQVDDRTWRLVRADGTPLPGDALHFDVVLDRGVYKSGLVYEKGDGATHGGSFWIAQGRTTEKPGDGATSWRLAVKRGADGAKGDPGKPGERGLKGEKGDPGRNYT